MGDLDFDFPIMDFDVTKITTPQIPPSPLSDWGILDTRRSLQEFATGASTASAAGASQVSFAVSAHKGVWRSTMEDRIAASTTPNGGIVIGIFDGHGGSGVAKTLARGPPSSLTEIVATAIAATNTFPEIATKSFESFDRDILYPRRGECGGSGGSTASVVNIATGGAPTVQVASVGDSDVWLFRPGSRTKILLSVPHTPYTPSERERIRKCGAHVFGGRVNGTLAVSRAFGGFEWFKMTRGETLLPPSESAVTSTPLIGEVVDIFGGDGDNEALVVAATDGFWPLGAAAVDRLWGGAMISSDGAPLQDELDRMCVAASDESHDNATAVVIRFRK